MIDSCKILPSHILFVARAFSRSLPSYRVYDYCYLYEEPIGNLTNSEQIIRIGTESLGKFHTRWLQRSRSMILADVRRRGSRTQVYDGLAEQFFIEAGRGEMLAMKRGQWRRAIYVQRLSWCQGGHRYGRTGWDHFLRYELVRVQRARLAYLLVHKCEIPWSYAGSQQAFGMSL